MTPDSRMAEARDLAVFARDFAAAAVVSLNDHRLSDAHVFAAIAQAQAQAAIALELTDLRVLDRYPKEDG